MSPQGECSGSMAGVLFYLFTQHAEWVGSAHTSYTLEGLLGPKGDIKEGRWGSVCESCWAEGERRARSLTRLFEQPEEI